MGFGLNWKRVGALAAALFGFLIILHNGESYECRACNAVVFQGDRVVLVVAPRGGGPLVAAGAFPVSDVRAIVELRDEV
jgi:hypothetical protein